MTGLNKQLIPISFAKGLDKKSDPKQVVVGSFLELENVVFDTTNLFAKRNGYELVSTSALSLGDGAAVFRSELLGFDGQSLYACPDSVPSPVQKGAVVSVEVAATPVYRSTSRQTTQDSAYNSSGLYLHVWVDSINGAQYQVVAADTNVQVIAATNFPSGALYPRAFSIGRYLIATYVDGGSFDLKYIAISSLNPSQVTGPNTLSTVVDTSNPRYDGTVYNDKLYLCWNASDVGGAIRATYLQSTLAQGSTIAVGGESAPDCITTFIDSAVSPPTLWVAYFNGTDIKYFIRALDSFTAVLAPTTLVSGASNTLNITGHANEDEGKVYYQRQNTYSFASERSDYITKVSATAAGTVAVPEVLLRSVGLISKPFTYEDKYYFVTAFQSPLQPTYFVVNENGTLIGKFAPNNGGGYTGQNSLCSVNAVSSNKFQFDYLYKTRLVTQQGQAYAFTGVNSASLDFSGTRYQNEEIGNNLLVSGGFLWNYDGYGITEHNFHVYPETLGYTASTAASQPVGAGTYSYISLYEWTDNFGNIHRSGYGVPLTATIGNSSSGITVHVPTLRLTQKKGVRSPVSITLYRDAPSISVGIYYKVSSATTAVLNDTTVDSVAITDRAADSAIIGNELLYTTGGVVQNSPGPACLSLSLFKNRLMLLSAEDRLRVWFSKQVVQNEPVELSEEFTQFIDPRFGEVSATAVMDDKYILFKPNACFFQTGDGPDSTGLNNDFQEPVFITSVVGCDNPDSIVLTPDGLMFQSLTKGIWLLSRGLKESYIGADVETYNGDRVTSAVLIPDSTQVRFTLETGVALVYDYYYGQWVVFTNHSAVGAVIFQNQYTYLNANGLFYKEKPGFFKDVGSPYFIRCSTGWLSLAGLQGYERAYRLYLLGEVLSHHSLQIDIAYDFNSNATQRIVATPTSQYNQNYGDDPYYGSVAHFGGADQTLQYRLNLARQKCQSLRVTIQEGLDTSNLEYGAGLTLSSLGVLVGAKSTYPRLPPGRIKR